MILHYTTSLNCIIFQLKYIETRWFYLHFKELQTVQLRGHSSTVGFPLGLGNQVWKWCTNLVICIFIQHGVLRHISRKGIYEAIEVVYFQREATAKNLNGIEGSGIDENSLPYLQFYYHHLTRAVALNITRNQPIWLRGIACFIPFCFESSDHFILKKDYCFFLKENP